MGCGASSSPGTVSATPREASTADQSIKAAEYHAPAKEDSPAVSQPEPKPAQANAPNVDAQKEQAAILQPEDNLTQEAARLIQKQFRGKQARREVERTMIASSSSSQPSLLLQRRGLIAQAEIRHHCQSVTSERLFVPLLADREPLIEAGFVDLDAPVNEAGSTIMHIAAWNAMPKVVAFLLKHKAHADKLTTAAMSPLHVAIDALLLSTEDNDDMEGRCIDVIRQLVEAGADPNRSSRGVASPLDKADSLAGKLKETVIATLKMPSKAPLAEQPAEPPKPTRQTEVSVADRVREIRKKQAEKKERAKQ